MKRQTVAAPPTFVTTPETSRLEVYLRGRLGGRVHGLRVVQRGNGLVLQGTTRTFHVKQLAQHALMGATQLPLLSNDIEVG